MSAASDILQADYKLKIDYLTAHLGRMWTRFSFFLTINSALFGYSLQKDNALYIGPLVLFGVLLSLLWYYFAATDNFLVTAYRGQVAHVFFLLTESRELAFKAEGLVVPDCFSHVGSIRRDGFNPTTGQIEAIKHNFWQWRAASVSATELGVVFAIVFTLLWLLRAGVWLQHGA